jgi:2-polyprenyl-3-methyl-5-hydroxy-6-metoxy-1,4-benzoquinol methylase
MKESALTNENDWDQHYTGRSIDSIKRKSNKPTIVDECILNKKGNMVFELGCGGSVYLAKCALNDWKVSGIDFNEQGLNILKSFLQEYNLSYDKLIKDDIFEYDISELENQYDLLMSFGFLEHFNNSEKIISKWSAIVKPGGLVFSAIPNLFSINAYLFRKFAPAYWSKHVPYLPSEIDEMHISNGLIPIKSANYSENFNMNMLIPWSRIEERVGNKVLYKILRLSSFLISRFLQLLPGKGLKYINPLVIGVYRKP